MKTIVVAAVMAIAPLDCAAQTALDLFNRARGGQAEALAQLRAKAEAGDADSQFQLGRAFSHGASVKRDDAEAARWVEKAAQQGHLEAQSNMGYLYSAGLGVPRDPERALSWTTKSAEAGFVQAQFNLALSYLEGKLVPKDERKGFEWMKRAADQGAQLAQLNLGMLYGRGVGTERDPAQAAAWYRKAADQGNETAMLNLAVMHYTGEGVPRDPAEALRWIRRPYAQGNSRARGMREQLCREHPSLCAAEPAPAHFEFDMTNPPLRIVIPDAPPMQMGPHPLGQPHTRFMGGGPGGFTISVLTPTADQGTSAMQCARSGAASVARRFGLKREDVVLLQPNDATIVMLFPFKTDPALQLKAFLLSGHGGTHCIEVHLSKMLPPGSTTEADIGAWMKGFQRARIEAY